jgi:hypothetical protein
MYIYIYTIYIYWKSMYIAKYMWSTPCFDKPVTQTNYKNHCPVIIFPAPIIHPHHLAVNPPAAEKTRGPVVMYSFGSRSSSWGTFVATKMTQMTSCEEVSPLSGKSWAFLLDLEVSPTDKHHMIKCDQNALNRRSTSVKTCFFCIEIDRMW